MMFDMLTAVAEKQPDHPAIKNRTTTLNYSELCDAIRAFADHLRQAGLTTDSPVVVILPNGPDFVIATFAAASLGCLLVPINPSFQADELRYYLDNSGAVAVITSDAIAAQRSALIKEISPACAVITTSGTSPSVAATNRELVAGELLYQYSSGTTGTPKKIVRTQAALVQEARQYASTLGLGKDDCVLGVVPMSHSYGFGNCMMVALCAGATLYTIDRFTRREVADVLLHQGITVFPGVPFMFGVLAETESLAGTRFPDLKLAYTAGAPLGRDVFDTCSENFGFPIRQHYGSTETGPAAINLGSTEGEMWASVGQPVENVEIRIIREDGQVAAAGETGDVTLSSPSITRGYAEASEADQLAFTGGFFRTGDLGRLDEQGNLFITGRKKLVINVGGNKVDPGELEQIINAHPAVNESVVLGVDGGKSGEIIKAVIVCNQDVTADDIRSWCEGKVAAFKLPRIVEVRKEIPRSALGKVLLKPLQEPAGE